MKKNTLEELHTMKEIVKEILVLDPRARNSDSYLYLKVIQKQAMQKRVNLRFLSVVSFFSNLNEHGFANYESVGRVRRKLQNEFPELSGREPVQAARRENEEVFREWAVE